MRRSRWAPSISGTLVQKGQLPFVRAARELPDVPFVLAGKWLDDAVDELRAAASPNVELTGWLSQDALLERYRRAAVYVQASRHEGFGLAVAEAMLAGCVPVVVNATAMPEVVGEAGVLIESQHPREVADGVRRALELGPDAAHAGAPAYSHQLPDGEPQRRDPESGGGGAWPRRLSPSATPCCSSSAPWCTSCTGAASARPSCCRRRPPSSTPPTKGTMVPPCRPWRNGPQPARIAASRADPGQLCALHAASAWS